MNPSSRQQGFTLVELMIAVVIGLFIIAGVFQVYLSSRAAANLQDRMSNVQENGRFALFFLQRSIRKAGFPKSTARNPFTNTLTTANPTLAASAVCTMGPPTARCTPSTDTALATTNATCDGVSTAPIASDQIAVCYQGPATNCVGTTVASGALAADLFYINTDATTGVRRLMCNGYMNDGTSTVVNNQPLVDGIENMQVQYGEDTDNDGYANDYVIANNVSNWDKVIAVRVSLLVSTNSNTAETASGVVIGDTASDAQSYQVLEQSLPSTYLSTGVRGRLYTTTIELRNRTP